MHNIAIIYKENYYEYNTIIFNLFDIIYYLYFLYVFYYTSKKSVSRKIIKYGAAIFVLACILNLFFQDMLTEPKSYVIIVGSIFLVYAAVIYVIGASGKEQKISISKNLLFWISLGIIAFYSIYPVNMYILSFEFELFKSYSLSIFHHSMIGVLYMCYIIGFILMTKFKKFE